MTDDEQLAWVDDLRGRRVKPAAKVKTVKSRAVKKAVVESDGDALD